MVWVGVCARLQGTNDECLTPQTRRRPFFSGERDVFSPPSYPRVPPRPRHTSLIPAKDVPSSSSCRSFRSTSSGLHQGNGVPVTRPGRAPAGCWQSSTASWRGSHFRAPRAGTRLCADSAWSNITATLRKQAKTTLLRWTIQFPRRKRKRLRLILATVTMTSRCFFSFIWTERVEGRWAEGYDPITPCPGASVVRSASQMEETPPGTHFLASVKHVPGCKRRVQTRLGVVREIPLLGRGV